jgi:hypothetical protein
MKKRGSRTAGLSSEEQAWLRGENNTGSFFKFKMADELEALWKSHGDDSKMFWRRGMRLPITLHDLEECENAWLGTGKGSECFVHQHYSDEEKRNLWSERGDKDSFRWTTGMYKPLPLAA